MWTLTRSLDLSRTRGLLTSERVGLGLVSQLPTDCSA